MGLLIVGISFLAFAATLVAGISWFGEEWRPCIRVGHVARKDDIAVVYVSWIGSHGEREVARNLSRRWVDMETGMEVPAAVAKRCWGAFDADVMREEIASKLERRSA